LSNDPGRDTSAPMDRQIRSRLPGTKPGASGDSAWLWPGPIQNSPSNLTAPPPEGERAKSRSPAPQDRSEREKRAAVGPAKLKMPGFSTLISIVGPPPQTGGKPGATNANSRTQASGRRQAHSQEWLCHKRLRCREISPRKKRSEGRRSLCAGRRIRTAQPSGMQKRTGAKGEEKIGLLRSK